MEDEPATEIPDATYRGPCEHGYANLPLRDIAVEADRSNGSIHYHYDSKDQLFVSFLDVLHERFTERVGSPEGDAPRERLESLLKVSLADDADTSRPEFRTAMLELKAQAPYSPVLQERLTEFDEFLFEQLREILVACVDTGDFDGNVEPARTAEFLTTTITGAHTRHVAINQPSDRFYAAKTGYAERHLLADERPEVAR